MIEFKEGRFFSRFFFGKVEGGSVLATLYRDEDDEDWILLLHLATSVDDWWRVEIRNRTPLRAVFEAKKALTGVMIELGGTGEMDETVVESDDEMEIVGALAGAPYVHLVTRNDAKA